MAIAIGHGYDHGHGSGHGHGHDRGHGPYGNGPCHGHAARVVLRWHCRVCIDVGVGVLLGMQGHGELDSEAASDSENDLVGVSEERTDREDLTWFPQALCKRKAVIQIPALGAQ